MLGLIGAVLAVGISLCWYLPGIRAQGANRVLKRNDYWRTAGVYGFCYTCLLIIVTEILWDVVADRIGLTGLKRDILADFFRAALLEEFFKFTGFLLAKRSLKLRRKIDYIMIAGLIGLMYGVVEKAVLGNIAGVVVGLAIPMHITWQFNQGGHWFEYEEAKARNDRPVVTGSQHTAGRYRHGDRLGESRSQWQSADRCQSPHYRPHRLRHPDVGNQSGLHHRISHQRHGNEDVGKQSDQRHGHEDVG